MVMRCGMEGAGRHDRYVIIIFSSYSPLFFVLFLLSLLSQTTTTDKAGSSGTGQDGTMRAAQQCRAGRGAGGQEKEA